MQTEMAAPPGILIVDDKPDNLRLLTRMLADRGYKVRPAPSGAHALKTAQKEVPDLILLDVLMPEMDGFAVCQRLQADPRTRNVPVIFLSALTDLADKIKGFEAGGVDYITKPFHEKEVLLRVETHLKMRSLQQKLQTEALRSQTLTEAAFEGLLIHTKGRIIDVNPEAVRLFGRSARDLAGTELGELFPPEIRRQVQIAPSATFESEIVRPNRKRVVVEIRTKDLPGKDQQVIAIRDLSRQREVEQERQELLQENSALKTSLQDRYRFGDFIGRSPAMQKVYKLISKAAASDFPAVIYGESGTGKELAARTIHGLSRRKNDPFIIVNCGAVTESLFEREVFGHRKGAFTDAVKDAPGYLDAAQSGTLFLDELGELSLALQVKLLRVLENREYTPVGDVAVKRANARFIVATNRDLTELVSQGKFRQDLFYRIHVIQINLPPLRDRREDIRLLVEHILAQHDAGDKVTKLPAQLRNMLYHYDWPGNVRELINTIQRFLATDSVALPGQPETEGANFGPLGTGLRATLEKLEQRMIVDALEETGWRRAKTAALLKVPRRSLQRKMKKYGLQEIEV